MGKKQVNLKENPSILAKRQRMAAHIKEVDPNHRKLKFGAFLRKYGRVLMGGGIILAVVFCSIFAGVLTEWDPERTNISEAKLKPNSTGVNEYWFGVDKDKESTTVTLFQSANDAFVCHFYTPDGTLVEKPEAGVAYAMGVVNENVDKETVYYLTGSKSGKKLSTTEDLQKAASFFLEEGEDDYLLYTMKKDAKSYFNLTVRANRTKLYMSSQGVTEFKYNNGSKSLVTEVEREHVFGTDIYGRDMWSRLIFGSRNTLIVSLGAQMILMVSGTLLGLLCGYYTKVEKYLMRVLDAMATIPNLLLCLLMVSVFGSGVPNLMLAMSFHGIPGLARMVRNQVLSLREKEYIESEKAMGAGDLRTVILHILPACMSYLLVRFSTGLSGAILSMTSLSYLGVGLDPTIASWGGMIQNSQKIMFALPHTFMVPTIAIGVTVFGFSMLGDGLRDLLDPKLR